MIIIGKVLNRKQLFEFGRMMLGILVSIYGVMLMIRLINSEEEKRGYFEFWQYIAPLDYEGETKKEKIENFIKMSNFEFQRCFNIMCMIVGGGLLYSDHKFGPMLTFLSYLYYTLVYFNPFIH
jgi:hypothetical protein